MRTFTDAQGEIWTVQVDLFVARQLKKYGDFDVMALPKAKWKPLAEVLEDPVRLCDVLYFVCEKQCLDRELSDDDFGRRLFGDSIEQAGLALLEAIGDFFPSPSHRALMQKLVDAARKAMTKTEAESAENLAKISTETLMEQMIAFARPKNSGEPPTEPPPSSA